MSKFIVFFDIETASLAAEADVIQIAALALDEDSWDEAGSFEAKVLFDEQYADAEALKINHYDAEIWKKEALTPTEACRRFASFVRPFCSIEMMSKAGNPYSVAKLAGHNAVDFDGPRLKRMFANCGAFFPCSYHIRDTLQRAMWWFDERPLEPRPKNLKLGTLAERFGINIDGDAHNALTDVRTCAALARAMRDTVTEAQHA